MERLVGMIRQYFVWDATDPDWEWTVEANPNDLSPATIHQWCRQGVTRFSLGAQSFRPAKLRLLERTHGADDIRAACQSILNAPARLSLDLIFAVPNETVGDWQSDLRAAIDCQAQHISTYQLTYEKGTQFWNRLQRGNLTEAEQDLALSMYQTACETLRSSGFEHYEVSNFAQPGQRSRHNCVYWTGRPYFAFGPGAASYLEGVRRVNHRSTTTYIKRLQQGQSPVAEEDRDGPEMRAREYFVFGMRMRDGIHSQTFAAETGFDVGHLFGKLLERDSAHGWLGEQNGRWRLSDAGLYVSDSLWPDYLEANAR
jgi:oxygen-independent coproporphyrinogen-3 oxidase